MVAELRKRKEKAVPAKAEEMPPTKKAARAPPAPKRKAADDASTASPIASKKQKPVKKAAETEPTATEEATNDKPAKSAKATKKSKAKAPEPKKEDPVQEEEQQPTADEEEEVDDQTKALVAEIDSGDDETHISTGENKNTFKEGQDVGKIPKVDKKNRKEKAVISTAKGDGTGVVYVGRIPHGFYEHEMKQYFSQFGPISRLRLSRNKKTGASKHYAFIEFADEDTAEIVSKTMDGYLLFGHILRCKVVPKEKVHESLWKGANRRFKKVPWNKMAGKQLEKPLAESKWEGKISKEEKRRSSRADKLKEMGYEFEAPALKAAEAKASVAIENGEEAKAIEAPVAEKEKEAENVEEPTTVEEEKTEGAAEPKKTKATKKKVKKAKA